jgi:voltage-gated potassium channel
MSIIKTKEPSPSGKIAITLALLFVTISSGVVGFVVIEGYSWLDALYMTVITVSTVGYKEVRPLSDYGKIFDMFLIVINLGLFTYFISTFTSYFLDGEFRKEINHKKMERSITALRGHTILCGYGRNGRAAADVLRQNNVPFVVVEKDVRDKRNIDLYVEGDATREETLTEAGIDHAGALITTLPDDAANLYIVLSARQLSKNLRIISRASDDQAVKKMKIAGADNVIMPDKIGGTHMATLVLSPDVKEFMDMLAAQGFDGTTIQEVAAGKAFKLNDLDHWRATGANILAIKNSHQQYIMNPTHDMLVGAGDRIMVMGSKEQIESIRTLIA